MTTLTSDPRTVSSVTAATMLPILLFSLVSGVIADAMDRRRVLLVAQSVMLAASALLAWLTAYGSVTPASLVALTFVIGCGFALNAPAWQAAVRDLVPARSVPAAISLNIVGVNLSRTAGPALGGLVVAFGGPQLAFTANAVSFLGLMGVLGVWLARPVEWQRHAPEPPLAAIPTGLNHAWRTRELRRILIRVAAFGVALGALPALIPLVVRLLGAAAAMAVLVPLAWRMRVGEPVAEPPAANRFSQSGC